MGLEKGMLVVVTKARKILNVEKSGRNATGCRNLEFIKVVMVGDKLVNRVYKYGT